MRERVFPIFFRRSLLVSSDSAASEPVTRLLLYIVYFPRNLRGVMLGIITFAPARMPCSIPSLRRVSSAVVAGRRR